MNNIATVLKRVGQLDIVVNRLQVSIKSDVQGISQKDKRLLSTSVKNIYKELAILTKQQREEA